MSDRMPLASAGHPATQLVLGSCCRTGVPCKQQQLLPSPLLALEHLHLLVPGTLMFVLLVLELLILVPVHGGGGVSVAAVNCKVWIVGVKKAQR